MITMWRVSWHYGHEIKRVDAIRVTDQFVVMKPPYGGGEVRESKVTRDHRYFATWTEARDAMKDRLHRELTSALEEVERLKTNMGTVINLTQDSEFNPRGL